VWSAGDGNYLVLAGNQQSKQDDMNLALASATGVSGGAAGTPAGHLSFSRQRAFSRT